MTTFNFNLAKVILQQFMKIYILILLKKNSKTCTKCLSHFLEENLEDVG